MDDRAMLIDALVAFSGKRELLEKWPTEKIQATLRKCVLDMQISLNRAAIRSAGQEIPALIPRASATIPERLEAIYWLENAGNTDDICQTIWATSYVFTDAECRRVRSDLIKLLRESTDAPSGPEDASDAAGATEPLSGADSTVRGGQCPVGPARGLKTDPGGTAGRNRANAHPSLPGL